MTTRGDFEFCNKVTARLRSSRFASGFGGSANRGGNGGIDSLIDALITSRYVNEFQVRYNKHAMRVTEKWNTYSNFNVDWPRPAVQAYANCLFDVITNAWQAFNTNCVFDVSSCRSDLRRFLQLGVNETMWVTFQKIYLKSTLALLLGKRSRRENHQRPAICKGIQSTSQCMHQSCFRPSNQRPSNQWHHAKKIHPKSRNVAQHVKITHQAQQQSSTQQDEQNWDIQHNLRHNLQLVRSSWLRTWCLPFALPRPMR